MKNRAFILLILLALILVSLLYGLFYLSDNHGNILLIAGIAILLVADMALLTRTYLKVLQNPGDIND